METTECSVCGNSFKSMSNLNKHLQRKTPCVKKIKTLLPLVKWSGGKRDEIDKILPHLPASYEVYIEPFIGGGSLYFHLKPESAVINDVHKELIDLYSAIKNGHSSEIYEYMKAHDNTEEVYYKVRATIPADDVENAKRFFYLRKTCYRGMLRYNRQGKFNIPFGKYKTYNYEEILNEQYEQVLKNTEIYNQDFSFIFDNYDSPNNFMFLDPPYDSEFTDYGYCVFGKAEQIKLNSLFKETKIKCLMIIGKTPFIEELYAGYIVDEYEKKYRFKLHSGRVDDKINTTHLVIKNY